MARSKKADKSGGSVVTTVLFLLAAAGLGVAAVHYLAPEAVSAQLGRLQAMLGM